MIKEALRKKLKDPELIAEIEVERKGMEALRSLGHGYIVDRDNYHCPELIDAEESDRREHKHVRYALTLTLTLTLTLITLSLYF